MNWGSFEAFLAMGGYGPYVWGTYVVTTLLLTAEVLWLRGRRRTIMRRIGLMRDISRRRANEIQA